MWLEIQAENISCLLVYFFFFDYSLYMFFFSLKYNFINFNWRLIILQYCIGFAGIDQAFFSPVLTV